MLAFALKASSRREWGSFCSLDVYFDLGAFNMSTRTLQLDDLPQRFCASVRRLPEPLGLFYLLVNICKWAPEEAARKVGIPLRDAQSQLLLARSIVRNGTCERGEARS